MTEEVASVRMTALRAHGHGLCVVPPAEDETKRPCAPVQGGSDGRCDEWKGYQAERPERAQLERWYSNGRQGVGVITGKVSGGLELFEFDDFDTYRGFKQVVRATGLGPLVDQLENGYLEKTPSGGIHWLYRCEEVGGSQKLASRPVIAEDGKRSTKILIQTKGEGGYVVIAPSHGRVHPSGRPYELLRGGVDTIITIPAEEREELLRLARTFDEMPSQPRLEAFRSPLPPDLARPGDDFNQRARWEDLLIPAGWKLQFGRGQEAFWCRPGKQRGVSATTNYADTDYLYVFSNSTILEANRPYSKFAAYTHLYHGGDFGAAARDLRAQGYGAQSIRGTVREDDNRLTKGSQELDDMLVSKESHATKLVALAQHLYEFGLDESGNPFAVPRKGPSIARTLGSRGRLQRELAGEYHRRTGTTPPTNALRSALETLSGLALEQERTRLFTRLAEHEGAIWLDLGRADGRVVKLTSTGWSVEERAPVIFRRTELTQALPIPQDGDLEELRQLLNVRDDQWSLIVGWEVSALIPEMPHPILILLGRPGTAKTTTARFLSSLIDRSPAQVRSAPKNPDDWSVAASGSWVVTLDNLSHIEPWFSDALAKGVTGEAYVRRALYTDDGIAVNAYKRCIIITGITLGRLAGDLLDRSLLVELDPVSEDRRREERELTALFEEMRPRLLGGLLTLTSRVLARLPEVSLPSLPRMADFARLLAALDAEMGSSSVESYLKMGREALAEGAREDPLGQAILALVGGQGCWSGTASELLKEVAPASPSDGWPKTAPALARALDRIAAELREAGVELRKERTRAQRIITMRVISQVTDDDDGGEKQQ